MGRIVRDGICLRKLARIIHEVRDAKNNEVHDVQNNARQVCERARAGERPVSCVCARR